MIHGYLTHAGTMIVDGEECTGVFVSCSVDELRNNKAPIYKDVEIHKCVEVK
jgi:hypothetical protein